MTSKCNQQKQQPDGAPIGSYTYEGQIGSEGLFLFGTGFLGKPRAMFLLRIFREKTAETPVEITAEIADAHFVIYRPQTYLSARSS